MEEASQASDDMEEAAPSTGDESMDYEWVYSVELFYRINVF
jgi:hypothetical protein